MLNHHAAQHANRPALSLAKPLAYARVQRSEPAQFANRSEWLAQRKAALRAGFGFRCGGTKLLGIALALKVDEAKASRLLNDDHDVHITEKLLARLDGTEFAHVAAAVRAVRLGLPLAGEGLAA